MHARLLRNRLVPSSVGHDHMSMPQSRKARGEREVHLFFLLLKDHCASVPLGKALVHVASSPHSPATGLSFSFRIAGLWP